MSWDELIKYSRRWVEAHKDNTFQHEAARRMAVLLDAMEALLADDVIERAARALFYGDVDPDLDVTWTTAHEGVRAEYLAMASNALTAALGEDEGDE